MARRIEIMAAENSGAKDIGVGEGEPRSPSSMNCAKI
jgi:hypothetical protein